MNRTAGSPGPSGSAQAPTTPDTRLHGRLLVLARVGWLVVVISTLALFVGSLPTYYALLQTPCGSSSFPCGNLTGALNTAGLQELQKVGFSASSHAAYIIAVTVAIAVVWVTVGLVIFWRRSDDWVALLGALALLSSYIGQTSGATTALVYTYPAWAAPVEMTNFLSQAALAFFVCLFPSGRFAPRWVRWGLALFLLFSMLAIFSPADSPLNPTNWPPAIPGLIYISTFGMVIFSQIYRYRRVSNAVQRQQVKWAVFGIIFSFALLSAVFLFSIVSTPNPTSSWLLLGEVLSDTGWLLAFLPIPIFFGLAILRSRLWDIDALINKALVYGSLTGLLGALYAGLIIGLESLAGLFGGNGAQNPVVLVVSTLAIAALFQPVRKRLQMVIGRRFYRKKYDAEKTLAAFSATLRQEVDLEQIRTQLHAVVQETMQPTHVSLWLRQSERHPTDQAHRLELPGSPLTERIRD